MEVAPKTARERRRTAARFARVERWAEDSGNAALMGRELPRMRCWRVISGSAGGPASCARRAWTAGWTSCAPARSWTWSWAKTPDPARTARQAPATTPPAAAPAAAAGSGSTGGGSAGGHAGSDSGGGAQTPPGAGPGNGGAGGFAGRVTLTVPLGTAAGLSDRPGELGGHGPVDPWLARDLANAAAANPKTTWCITVTDQHGHAVGHGCARPEPKGSRERAGPGPPGRAGNRDGTGFSFSPASRDGPPGGYGTWRLRTPGGGPDLIVAIDSLGTDPCQHQYQARGHDPGVRLRHLSQIRHATCTSPVCRRPAAQCDFEHNVPYEAGGRTCLCNTGPKCRYDHRLKQQPGWKVDQLPDGTFRWTTPAGRSYDTEPTRYPI